MITMCVGLLVLCIPTIPPREGWVTFLAVYPIVHHEMKKTAVDLVSEQRIMKAGHKEDKGGSVL